MWLHNKVPASAEIFPQLLATLTATLNSVSDGMQYGWTAPMFPLLRSNTSTIHITEEDETWMEFTYLSAGLVGLPFTIYLVDQIGRIRLILVSSSLCLISWIIIAFASTTDFLYISRFLSGLAENMSYVAIPMYISEIANQNIRGLLTGFAYLMVLLGVLIVYSVVPFCPYYIPSIIGSSFLIAQLILVPFMPESPYFLLSKGKKSEAKRSLSRLRGGKEKLEKEFEEISNAVEKKVEGKSSIKALFLNKGNKRAFIIITLLTASQQFVGYTVLVMNVHSILIEADSVYMASEITGIIFSILMLIAATVCILSVDKFGRKALLITSGVTTGICLMVLSIYMRLKYANFDVLSLSWLPILSVMAYAITFKLGLGFLPQVIIAEVFSNKTKAIGMTLGDGLFNVFSCLSILFYQYLALSFGIDVPLFIFSVASFLSAVFTVFFVPETRGKTLEEIQLMLNS